VTGPGASARAVPAPGPAPGGAGPTVRPPGVARRCRPPARPALLVLALALGLALGLVAPRRSAAQGAPPAPPPGADPVALATALNAAWNAGQVEGVVALFAAEATVRQRGADLEGFGPHVAVRDMYGVALTYVGEPPRGDGRGVTWAAGAPEVRAWARPLLVAGHRVEATGYRTSGDGATATWDYTATADAFRRLPGVGPTAGTAELTVRGDRIVSLTLASDPASVAARAAAVERAAAAGAARAAQATAVAASGVLRRTPDTQGRGTPAVGPWIVAAALALAGVVVLAALKRPPEAP
jgi:hypothetical protein